MQERQLLTRTRRVVVKVGTSVVSRPDGRLALGRLGELVEALATLMADGREVILVTSGAVGLGARRLGMGRPRKVVDRQACAAVGQSLLMSLYESLFRQLGMRCAQVLLTEEDFKARHRYVHLSATLDRLLDLGVVPVINENDTVSTAEIALTGATVFGDNDRLSALVASGLAADALVLLSDVDGVYTGPPRDPGSRRLGVLQDGQDVSFGAASTGGRGGMEAKIAAARQAAASGVHTVIADGLVPARTLAGLFDGRDVGTWIVAQGRPSHRKRWLAFATAPSGQLWVNDGARQALTEKGASLLPVGVIQVVGTFDRHDVVSICDAQGLEIGRGRVTGGRNDVELALQDAGEGKARPLVHRDHVVMWEATDE